MNFKTIGLKAAIATAVIAGSALAMSSAQALSISGKSPFKTVGADTTVNFTKLYNDGDLTGGFTSVSGPLSIAALKVTDTPFSGFSNASSDLVYNFISGFKYAGFDAFLSLNPAKYYKQSGLKSTIDADAGTFTGTTFFGEIRKFSDGSLLGDYTGVFSASSNFGKPGNFQIDIDAKPTAVPTPALLPGLLALGAGVLRKRKAEAIEEAKADA